MTTSAGVEYEHGGGDTIFFMGGGVAAGDFDNDGWIDLYALGGYAEANLLLRNRGDGTFEDVAQNAGVALSNGACSGPLFVDIDGDTHLDLLIGGLEFSPTYLFRNRGDGTFEDRTALSGLPAFERTFGSAFADIDGDGDLDGFIAQWTPEPSDVFWRNDGDFSFTHAPGVFLGGAASAWIWTFTPNFSDLDDDGWLDLLVAADFNHSQVFMNRGGAFEQVTDENIIIDQNGMGAAIGDYDRDGVFDWFVTAIRPEGSPATGNRLYRGLGDGSFEDTTEVAGVSVGYWGWGACFADFDNDGWIDILHTNGFRHPPFEDDPTRLFMNQGDGTFVESAAAHGLDDRGQGRGVVCFDYDRDGDIDLFVANNSGTSSLYRNDLDNANHYLQVALSAPAPNSQGIGAKLTVRRGDDEWIDEIRAGNNFVSQNPAEAHFGLGASTLPIELEVRWPGGAESKRGGVGLDQFLTVEMSEIFRDGFESGQPDAWSFSQP